MKQPWITPHIKRLSRKKQRLYNQAKLSNSPHYWDTYQSSKREIQKKCRMAYRNYMGKLFDENGTITKRLWTYIKSQRKDHCGIAPLVFNGTTHCDSSIKAKILNEYFTSVFTPPSPTTFAPMEGQHIPDIEPIYIDTNGVTELLQKLKPHKATGPDEIPAYLLKETSNEMAPILTFIFQASLLQSSVPSDWKKANIVPLFKKGDRTVPNNYRPVSLTCICSKILEHIVYSHIFTHLTQYDILSDQQHGFRHLRSCETQLILTVNDLAESLNKMEQTDVIFLDFSKAFDRVSHPHLFHKLHHYGIRGHLLTWIKDFVSNRSQCVIVNGHQSDPAPVTSGVPQGTVLAPLLFLCFINDITNKITSRIRLYADDVLLYTTIHLQEDCQRLQKDLHTLEEWAITWKMLFNSQKCEFLRVTNKKYPILMQYNIQGETIREVTHAKYLGVTIDQHLSWSEHIKQITNKAYKVKGFLQRNLYSCPPSVKSNCYKALIKPILDYAATIWAPHTQKDIMALEKVQRNTARFVYNNYSHYASVSEMLRCLNWSTLAQGRNEQKLTMMYKIVHQLVDIQASSYLIPATTIEYTRGHHMRFTQPFTRIDSYLYSFFPSSIKLWNALPNHILNSTNIEQFKQRIAGLSIN